MELYLQMPQNTLSLKISGRVYKRIRKYEYNVQQKGVTTQNYVSVRLYLDKTCRSRLE